MLLSLANTHLLPFVDTPAMPFEQLHNNPLLPFSFHKNSFVVPLDVAVNYFSRSICSFSIYYILFSGVGESSCIVLPISRLQEIGLK